MGEGLYDNRRRGSPEALAALLHLRAGRQPRDPAGLILVRRLLENGANTSFANCIGDASDHAEPRRPGELLADPRLRRGSGARTWRIPACHALFAGDGGRRAPTRAA